MYSKVYHVDVLIADSFGNLNVRLYFPSAEMRRHFVATHKAIVRNSGRRPLDGTVDDINRTRLNLTFYSELRDFVYFFDKI